MLVVMSLFDVFISTCSHHHQVCAGLDKIKRTHEKTPSHILRTNHAELARSIGVSSNHGAAPFVVVGARLEPHRLMARREFH